MLGAARFTPLDLKTILTGAAFNIARGLKILPMATV
jgi:hypothetical protein